MYNTFFHNGPSDKQLGSSLVSLVVHFEWLCINIISSKDKFSRGVGSTLKKDLENRGVWIPVNRIIAKSEDISSVIFEVRARGSTAVNVVVGDRDLLVELLSEAKKHGLTKRFWVGFHAWDRNLPFLEPYIKVIHGMFWLLPPEDDLGKFQAQATEKSRNISKAYCAWVDKGSHWPGFCNVGHVWRESLSLPMAKAGSVMNSVVAIADGMELIFPCSFNKSKNLNCTIHLSLNLTRERLATHLAHLELNVQYDIVNMRFTEERALITQNVGKWTKEQKLVFRDINILCSGNGPRVPYSGCRDKCPSNTTIKYYGTYCWSCEKCLHGQYNDESNSSCEQKHQTSNDNQSIYMNNPLTIITPGGAFACTLNFACVLGAILTSIVIAVIVRYQDTPVVKAKNLSFSIFSLVVLLAWFLTPLLYIGKPSNFLCKMRTVSLAMTYTAISSVLLTKTNRLVKIFAAVKIQKHPFLSNWWYGFLTGSLIFVQFMLVASYLYFSGPQVIYNCNVIDSLVVTCKGSWRFDIALLAYNFTLSMQCSWSAYRARHLPRAYKEFKWICLAIIINFLSWLAILVTRYLSAISEKYNLVCIVMLLLFSAYSTLSLLFLPQIWMVLFRSEINTKEAVMKSTRRYSEEQAAAIDFSPIQSDPRLRLCGACSLL